MKMNSMLFVVVFAFAFCVEHLYCDTIDHFGLYGGIEIRTQRPRYSPACMDIKPQHSLDIEQIMGLWYGSEIIMHTTDTPGVHEYPTCVIVHLADITEQMHMHERGHELYNKRRVPASGVQTYGSGVVSTTVSGGGVGSYPQSMMPPEQAHYLRLVWHERESNLEYTFNYTASSPGLWTNVEEQRGSMVSDHYTQFSGSVQVVKAVSDHLVLTFCGTNIKSTIFTIVLSRQEDSLTIEELRSIRNLLSRRGLYPESIRKVCLNAADTLKSRTSIMLMMFWAVYSIMRQRADEE